LFWRHHGIERRAAEIEDPLERLRYLRLRMERPAGAIRVLKWRLSPDFWKTRGAWIVLSMLVLTAVAWRPGHSTSSLANVGKPVLVRLPMIRPPAGPPTATPAAVWLVETRDGVENYSNGLRIDNKYAVANEPREKFAVYGYAKTDLGIVDYKTTPAGIVYHTTESHLAPFEPGQNRRLVRIGSAVLEYVQSKRCYHFVIDRFGRVFRIVNETDRANHAGNSIWGDDKGAYVNLNDSFLGVAFESATETEDEKAPIATPAQIHSARVLTDMLRAKYKIAPANCVTHAQVSVNPSNMLIGYHTDWAGVFPFAEMGLPDNYGSAPASLYAFGFGYDGSYVKIVGNRVWQGLLVAEDQMQRQASAAGLPFSKYRSSLQQRYREITTALKSKSPGKEKGDEIER
jgi:N-acetylmuramoyl-L-alanine amidase